MSLLQIWAFIICAIVACITGGAFAGYFHGLVAAAPVLTTPFFVGPVNGIVVSLICYAVLGNMAKRRHKHKFL